MCKSWILSCRSAPKSNTLLGQGLNLTAQQTCTDPCVLCTFTGQIFFPRTVSTDWAFRLLAASTFLAVSRATYQAIYLQCWFTCQFVSYLSQITHTSSRSALSFITVWMHSSSDRWSSAEVFWGARQVGELINKRKQQDRGWEKKEESVKKRDLKKWDQPRSRESWVDVCFLGFQCVALLLAGLMQ